MNAYELACNIIAKANVGECKITPKGAEVEEIIRFMGRGPRHECFISEKQASYLGGLMGNNKVLLNGEGADKFGAFIKTIWSEKNQKNYWLLVFCGYVASPETVVESQADYEAAHQLAKNLIAGAIASGKASRDKYTQEEVFCTWLTVAQHDQIVKGLGKTAINDKGLIITQAVGSFCYWSKLFLNNSVLLCWMGDVPVETVKPVEPKPVETPTKQVQLHIPEGKLIPLDADIPF